MKKKLLTLVLVSVLALSAVACGTDSKDTKQESDEPETAAETETNTDAEAEGDATEVEAVIAPYEAELAPGDYYAGLHFPEGVYNIEVVSGLGYMSTTSGIHSAMGSGSVAEYSESYNNATLSNGDILHLSQSLTVKISTQEACFSSMGSYDNPATEEVELSAGTYVVSQDIAAGVYDISVVDGTGNVTLADYSFTAMLSTNEALAESTGTTCKNVELQDGDELQISSMTIKLTPSASPRPLTP